MNKPRFRIAIAAALAVVLSSCGPKGLSASAEDGQLRIEIFSSPALSADIWEGTLTARITNVSKEPIAFLVHPRLLWLQFVEISGHEIRAMNELGEKDFTRVSANDLRILRRHESFFTTVCYWPSREAKRGFYRMQLALYPLPLTKVMGANEAVVREVQQWTAKAPLVAELEVLIANKGAPEAPEQ